MKCAVCNSDINGDFEACPNCGAEPDERLLPSLKEVGTFFLNVAKATDRRVRVAVVCLMLFGSAFIAYQLFPGYGTVKAHVTWRDDISNYPVVGARVVILRNGKIQAERTTNDEGKFEMELPIGDVELIVADLHSIKTGREDYRLTDRFWVARYWRKAIYIPRSKTVTLELNPENVDKPDIKFFSIGQLSDYRNRAGWETKGPFTQEQVNEMLVGK